MRRKIHVLLLGFETPQGQTILKKLTNSFPSIRIAAPTGIYQDEVYLPQNFIPVNFSSANQMSAVFQTVCTVVSCDKKYNTKKIIDAAKTAKTKFINSCYDYPFTVVNAAYYKFSFVPLSMTAQQSASGIGFSGFWRIAHQKSLLKFPERKNDKWTIEQDDMLILNKDIRVTHRIEFSNRFFAILFWIFALLLRLIYPLGNCSRTYSSQSDWRFFGETSEFDDKYRYIVSANCVDASVLRCDLAILDLLLSLNIKEDESCDWNSFLQLKIKLEKYDQC